MTVEVNLEMGACLRRGPVRDDIEALIARFPTLALSCLS